MKIVRQGGTQKGLVFFELERFDESLPGFERALEIAPGVTGLRIQEGACSLHDEAVPGSIRYL